MTGSIFIEVDTGKKYAFDETSSGTWYEVPTAGGEEKRRLRAAFFVRLTKGYLL